MLEAILRSRREEQEILLMTHIEIGYPSFDDSLRVVEGGKLEPSLLDAKPGVPYQFERLGYFVADPKRSKLGAPEFLRTVTLRDSWAKLEKKLATQAGG